MGGEDDLILLYLFIGFCLGAAFVVFWMVALSGHNDRKIVDVAIKAGYYKIGRFDDEGNRLPFIIKVEVEDHDWQIFKDVYEVVTWNGGVDIYFNEDGNFDSLSFVTRSWSITFEEKEDDKNEDNSTGKEN